LTVALYRGASSLLSLPQPLPFTPAPDDDAAGDKAATLPPVPTSLCSLVQLDQIGEGTYGLILGILPASSSEQQFGDL
jgi:hypothetical protein